MCCHMLVNVALPDTFEVPHYNHRLLGIYSSTEVLKGCQLQINPHSWFKDCVAQNSNSKSKTTIA